MGYCHYWEQYEDIDEPSFTNIVRDFERVLLILDDLGVSLAGPLGTGPALMSLDRIAFNGVWHCGHPRNEEIVIPFPAERASGIGDSAEAVAGDYFGMGTLLRHRTCDGNCSYETFSLLRRLDDSAAIIRGEVNHSCKTAFRPYDLAVQCVLLIAKHHLGDRIGVSSSGNDYHWNDARRICYLHLNYPLAQYRIDREAGLVLS